MKYLLIIFIALIGQMAFGQSDLAQGRGLSLQEGFEKMRASAQTFQDYKVIKEVKLDEFWKTTMDSIQKQKMQLDQKNESIATLTEQLQQAEEKTKTMQASVSTIVYDSQHISFFGISFTKWFFITLSLAITAGLIFVIVVLLGRSKLINHSIREVTENLKLVASEFEQYKRRALEKEKKLSRELQTERNKLV